MKTDRMYDMGIFKRAMVVYYLSLPVVEYSLMLFFIFVSESCNQARNNCIIKTCVTINIGSRKTEQEIRQIQLSIKRLKYVYAEKYKNDSSFTVIENTLIDNITCKESSMNPLVSRHDISLFVKALQIGSINLPNNSKVPASVDVKIEHSVTQISNIPTFVKVLHYKTTYHNSVVVSISSNSFLAQTIITYITMSMSIFALAISLLLFVVFKMFNSLPDHICINIIILLLLFYLVYIFAISVTSNPYICFSISVVLHFLILSTFSWTSHYSFHITKTLSNLQNNISFNHFKSFQLKIIYISSYSIPLILVAIAVCFDVFLPHQFNMEYNGEVCFPTGYPGNIAFVTGPILFSIFLNIIILFRTFIILRRTWYNSTNLNKSIENSILYVIAFIKLCLFSGVFWIIGVLSQIFSINILAYIFIITCGSQGVIFSFCFLTSSRMRKNMSKMFQKTRDSKCVEDNQNQE